MSMVDDSERLGELIDRSLAGDPVAENRLWASQRSRLRRLVVYRLDPRIRGRVDPSDVVQETFIEAHRQLAEYARSCPLPFYPWLRQLACERLAKIHRRHLATEMRSVNREEQVPWNTPDESVDCLAARLAAHDTGPVQRLVDAELRRRVRQALEQLSPEHREVLLLRVLEEMTAAETAAVLGISEPAVRMRQLRALERFGEMFEKQR